MDLGQKLISIFNAIDKIIRELNIPDEIYLPRIIVVGEQSSGKSSVLEFLIDEDILPKGLDMVTRTPIIVQMQNTSNLNNEKYMMLDHLGDRKITNAKEIQEEILKQTNKLVSENDVCSEPIVCKVFSPSTLNLTIVDLPGIKKNTHDNNVNLIEKIKSLVAKEASRENVIILSIIQGSIDLDNSEGLHYAESADPEGKRTIGIITKIDVQEAQKPGLAYRLLEKNKYITEKRKFIGLYLRSEKDHENKLSRTGTIDREMEFLKSLGENANDNDFHKKHGINYLKRFLERKYLEHIKECKPIVMKKIKEIKIETEKKLKNIPETIYSKIILPNDKYIQTKFIIETIANISQNFENMLLGNHSNQDFQIKGGALIMNLTHHILRNNIETNMNSYLINLTKEKLDFRINNLLNMQGKIEFSEKAFISICKEAIKDIFQDCCIDISSQCLEKLELIVDEMEFNELQECDLLKENLKKKMIDAIRNLYQKTESLIKDYIIAEINYINFSNDEFRKEISNYEKILDFEKLEKKRLKLLSNQINNDNFKNDDDNKNNKFEDRKIDNNDEIEKSKEEKKNKVKRNPKYNYSFSPVNELMNSTVATQFIQNQNSNQIINMTTQIVQSQIPQKEIIQKIPDLFDDDPNRTGKYKKYLELYLTVIKKNLLDLIPKIIYTFLVKDIKTNINKELQIFMNEKSLDELILKNDEIENTRKNLIQNLERLNQTILDLSKI